MEKNCRHKTKGWFSSFDTFPCRSRPSLRTQTHFEIVWRTQAPDVKFSSFFGNIYTAPTNFIPGMWTRTFHAKRLAIAGNGNFRQHSHSRCPCSVKVPIDKMSFKEDCMYLAHRH